jgi:hypothetical protein
MDRWMDRLEYNSEGMECDDQLIEGEKGKGSFICMEGHSIY